MPAASTQLPAGGAGPRSTRPSNSSPAPPWTTRSTQVRKGDVGGAVEQQGDTLILHFSSADPVSAATVQGIFSAFVDQANIAVPASPPTYTLQTQQVEDESLQPIQFIAPGHDRLRHRRRRGVRRRADADHLAGEEAAAPAAAGAGVDGDGGRLPGRRLARRRARSSWCCSSAISVLPFLGLQLNGAWYMAVPLVIAGTLAFLAIGLLVGSVAKTVGGRQRAGQPDHPADGVPVRRLHPAGGGAGVDGDGVQVPADGLPGRGHEGRDGARRGAAGRADADRRSCWPSPR